MLTIHTLTCDYCGESFQRQAVSKQLKHFYCSRKCSTIVSNKSSKRTRQTSHLNPGNRLDEFSPFRKHLTCATRRAKGCTLSLQDLKDQWDLQEGTCPYTGWILDNPVAEKDKTRNPKRASLDRIDSTKGYEVGNIEFVSMMANFAKNNWTKEEVIEFGKAIASKH